MTMEPFANLAGLLAFNAGKLRRNNEPGVRLGANACAGLTGTSITSGDRGSINKRKSEFVPSRFMTKGHKFPQNEGL